MERVAVVSSSIASVGYDAATMTMEVEFNRGDLYQYFDVPEHIYQGLLLSESCGRFFHTNVRDLYRFAKL